jgi:hypothetical protein
VRSSSDPLLDGEVHLQAADLEQAHETSSGTGLTQRTRCDGSLPSSDSSAGGQPTDSGTLRVQRGAKAQPSAHGSVSDGEPGIGSSGTPRGWSSRGTEASRPLVYGVLRVREQRAARRGLHDAPGVHDVHLVAQPGHHAEVVGDEHQRGLAVDDQRAQQLQDLRADRDVERGGRLVGDEQARLAGQRHRDHHALAQPPDSWCG